VDNKTLKIATYFDLYWNFEGECKSNYFV